MSSAHTCCVGGPRSWSRALRLLPRRAGLFQTDRRVAEILRDGEGGKRGRREVRWLLLRRRRASGGIQQRNETVELGIVGYLEGGWTRMLSLEME
jgi:hypothetical protein